MGVKLCQHRPCVGQLAQLVQPHGVKPFKNVPPFTVNRQALVFFKKPLDVLKASNDALFKRSPAGRVDGGNFYAQRIQQFVIAKFSHCFSLPLLLLLELHTVPVRRLPLSHASAD